MRRFESFLACRLEEYIAYRQVLGYSAGNLISLLLPFDRYLTGKKTCRSDFTPMFFLDFREQLKGEGRTVNQILSGVRGFFHYLVRKGLFAENPLQDMPPKPENCFIPFIFSSTSIDQLLETVQKRIRKTEPYFFTDLSVYLAIVLLARCGLRISEPLRLRLKHYRTNEKTIYIENTRI